MGQYDSALNRIYQEELGRDIGAEGAAYFGGNLANGQSLFDVRRSIQNSAEAQGNRQANTPQIGLRGSEAALQAGLAGSMACITAGLGQAGASIKQGQGFLQPFVDPGQQAVGLQGALSGAMGQQAQQQAFANYTDSPGQQFLRDRGEQAVLRNSSAMGGLGGGRVMQELQRQGMGLAQQDFSNQFNRLGQLSQMGFQGASGQAGLSGQLAGEQALGGRTAGGFAFGTGQALSQGRTRAAEQLAASIANTTQGLSSLQNQQGAGISQMIGNQGGNLANLLSGAGQQQGAGQTQLATILANLAAQKGSTLSGLPGIPGIQETKGMAGNLASSAKAVGTVMAMSDARLKRGITFSGQTDSGINLYNWDWTEEAKSIAGDQPTFGVIAQEVEEIIPSAVITGADGFKRVDYNQVAQYGKH